MSFFCRFLMPRPGETLIAGCSYRLLKGLIETVTQNARKVLDVRFNHAAS
jgi:hypothetical protein